MKADRLVSLLLLLQSAPRRTARDLAKRLEVCERTIYRDVDALCASGVPVYAERGPDGGIALADGYRKALTHFAEDEVRALFISGSAILADLGLGANLDRALEKLRGGFSDVQRKAAEKARGRIHIDQRRWYQSDPPLERLALLRRAVWDDRCLEIVYEDRQKARTTRGVEPYGLVSKAGVWYLVARTAEGYRSFRVERMCDVRERGERFERDAAFDLDAYWRTSSERMREGLEHFPVTLRVRRDAVDMITGFWPTRWIDRGGDRLLCVDFMSERAAISHLVTWGDAVDLIEPLSLCAGVLEHARELCDRYERQSARQ
ncbi:MAG TPA: WYL domain-containing protein [Candidatus Baltobacteraceae bacterium]|nr:WYL domain-containing protein [Candidatus Baltobacteraceae bacterium]